MTFNKWAGIGAVLVIPFIGFVSGFARAAEPAVVIPAPAVDENAPSEIGRAHV